MIGTTTIAIRRETRDNLKKLKKFWRESWDDVISRLIEEHQEKKKP